MKNRSVKNCTDSAYCGAMLEAQSRYNLGSKTIREIAEKSGAIIRIGRTVRFNFTKMDSYLERLSE